MRDNHKGFTIVELLIVLVIIGVLAAISIITYNTVQEKAHDSAIKSDLKQLAIKLELYHTEQSRYPIRLSELESLNFSASKTAYQIEYSNLIYCYSLTDPDNYAVIARSKSKSAYKISNADGGPIPYSSTMNCPTNGLPDAWGGFALSDNPQWRAWTH